MKEHRRLPHFKVNSTVPGSKDAYPEVLKCTIEGEYTPSKFSM